MWGNTPQREVNMNIYVNTTKLENSDNNVKGLVNLNFGNEFTAKNITIVEGKNGLFVSYPSYKTNEMDKDGNPVYKDIMHPVKGFGEKMSEAILTAFASEDGRSKIELADESATVSVRMSPINQDKDVATKGIGTIYVNDAFAVNNVTLLNGRNGMFVSMPAYKSKEVDENNNPVYKNLAYATSDGLKAAINKRAVESYKENLSLNKQNNREEKQSLINELDSKISAADKKEKETGKDNTKVKEKGIKKDEPVK